MRIGVPKEIMNHEYRIGLTPGAVRELVANGHTVTVQSTAGDGIGAADADYVQAGADIVTEAAEVFESSELIVKVKEPLAVERAMLKPHHVLLAYLHLAPDPVATQELQASGATCIAYETVTSSGGMLPLLMPMSEVAGRMSIQAGARSLEREHGGRGVLLSGVPGVEAGRVVILGAGTVGRNAAHVAVGTHANVTVLDSSLDALRRLDAEFAGRVKTIHATRDAIEKHVTRADLVIGAVLIPGGSAPKLVSRALIGAMQPGAVIVDVAIDQGGCVETARPTTHAEPTYLVDNVVHYCVSNMPGAVPRTSTYALNAATLPYILALANKGWQEALRDDTGFRAGLNVCKGHITHPQVAASLGQKYMPAITLLG